MPKDVVKASDGHVQHATGYIGAAINSLRTAHRILLAGDVGTQGVPHHDLLNLIHAVELVSNRLLQEAFPLQALEVLPNPVLGGNAVTMQPTFEHDSVQLAADEGLDPPYSLDEYKTTE